MWDFGSVWYKKLQKTMKKSFVLSQNFKPVGYRKSLITIKKAFPRVFPLDMLTFVTNRKCDRSKYLFSSRHRVLGWPLLGEYRLQFLGSESEETGFDSEYI